MDEALRIKTATELSKYCQLSYYENCNTLRYINYRIVNADLSWEEIITFVNLDLDYKFYSIMKEISDPDELTVLVNKYNQLPRDYIPEDLEEINPAYNSGTLLLRRKARQAFEEMCIAAENDGIYLTAISTFRSFRYQEKVYLSKKTSEMPLQEYQLERDKVSARAGHSEHQTGLAVDINDLEETFAHTDEGKWLSENCYEFGYILRYPKGKESITGYNYEPWHFRFVGIKLAEAICLSGLTYDEYYIRHICPEIKCNTY